MGLGPRRYGLPDLSQGRAAINLGLAGPQEIEIRPIEDIYRQGPCCFAWGFAGHGASG